MEMMEADEIEKKNKVFQNSRRGVMMSRSDVKLNAARRMNQNQNRE
jgi:hypothetical protein